MKVTLGQIFRLACETARDNIVNSSDEFSKNQSDKSLKVLSDDVETYKQILELMEFFEHCKDVPFEEVLCRCFEEEENE